MVDRRARARADDAGARSSPSRTPSRVETMGSATALVHFSRSIGGTLGVTVMGVIVAQRPAAAAADVRRPAPGPPAALSSRHQLAVALAPGVPVRRRASALGGAPRSSCFALREVPLRRSVRGAAARIRDHEPLDDFDAAPGLGPRRALGRERQAGRVLLRARVRLHAGMPTRARRRASATARPTCSSQGEITPRGDERARRRPRGRALRRARTATASATSRCACPTRARRTRVAVERGARGVREPEWLEDEFGRVAARLDRDLRRDRPHVRRPRGLRRAVPARLRGGRAERTASRRRPHALDHFVGNVELGQDGRVGRVLRARARLREHRPLRRRPDSHRVLGADVEGDGGRRRARSSSRSTSRPRGGARARSRSTSTSTAARASSTSRWPPTTSSPRSRRCRSAGVGFLRDAGLLLRGRSDRVGEIDESWDDLQRLGILVDRDEDGYLLQIFTKTGAGPADASSSR